MPNQENDSTSVIMNLENLQKEYSNLLISYKAAVSEYINYLNQPTTDVSFVTIKGYAYNGTGSAGQSDATTLQECSASCANLNNCTGATFVSNRCLVRLGDSPIIPSSNDSYAIVPKGKQLLLNMENINQQLISINQQLQELIQKSEPIYYKADEESSSKNQELVQNYGKLLEERENINELLDQYETLDNTQNENNIKLTQNYYSYFLLVIFSLIIIVTIYFFSSSKNNRQQYVQYVQYGGDLNKNSYFVVFVLFVLLIVIVTAKYFSKK
jgi:hypothetical protein